MVPNEKWKWWNKYTKTEDECVAGKFLKLAREKHGECRRRKNRGTRVRRNQKTGLVIQ